MIFDKVIHLGSHRRVKEDVQTMTTPMWEGLLWLRKRMHPYRLPRREVIDHMGGPTVIALGGRKLLTLTGEFEGVQGGLDTRQIGLSRLGVALVQGYIEGQKT